MTIEQAKSELMQMYGALAPNKQIAIDTLIKASVKSQEPQIRPKGHWKYDYRSADGHRVYHCSECGCYLKPKTSEYLSDYKWCSLCGADMREVEDGND